MSKQWEYEIKTVPKVDDLIFMMNEFGKKGWELVQLTGTTCIFKREKDEVQKREGVKQYTREVPQTGHHVG